MTPARQHKFWPGSVSTTSLDYMGVSENRGTPKSSILIGVFHYFHHPFWGVKYPYFWKPPRFCPRHVLRRSMTSWLVGRCWAVGHGIYGHLSNGVPHKSYFLGGLNQPWDPMGPWKNTNTNKSDDSPKYSKDLLQLVMKFRRNKYTVMVTCVSFLYIRQMHLACTNLELRWIYTNLIKNL